MTDKKHEGDLKDIVRLGPPESDDGLQPFLRVQDTEEGPLMTAGYARPVSDPETVSDDHEVLHLRHLRDGVYSVTATNKGPAKVNNQAFRSNWDTIFGGKQTVGQA